MRMIKKKRGWCSCRVCKIGKSARLVVMGINSNDGEKSPRGGYWRIKRGGRWERQG
jgi:hypothetical protein